MCSSVCKNIQVLKSNLFFMTDSLSDWLFSGRELSGEERDELVAAACYMHITREDTAKQFINQERYCILPPALV